MKLKTLVRPSRGLATVLTAGAVTLGTAGFVVAQAGAASADPTTVFTEVGSDTTQDVMNAFANVTLGSNELGSWNAVNPVSQAIGETITPANTAGGQCSFTRPNGSGQGLSAFRKSINPASQAAQLAIPPEPNCIDLSRSSSGVSNPNTAGVLVWIPFALDAVTGAIGSASTLPTAEVAAFTEAQLSSLYNCNVTAVTVGSTTVTFNPNTAGAGQQQINLYIPQSGSGTLTFWGNTLGFSPTAPPPCDHQTILAGPNAGTTVEEHNGLAVTSDPLGYMPFSIAQWISQSNHPAIDRRHSAVLQNINGVFPCTGNSNCAPSGGSLNTSFPITRNVYNILQTSQALGTGALAQLFATGNSQLCQDIFTIAAYGFATIPNCGSTDVSLRGFTTAQL